MVFSKRNKKQTARRLLVLLFACAFVVVCLAGCAGDAVSAASLADDSAQSKTALQAPSSSLPAPEPQELRVRFSAVGDNLIHNGIYMQAAERAGGNGYDFSYVYENLAYFFEPYDVNWINQETLVNDVLPPATYPCFSTPGPLGQAAYDAGWRVFALSNNHTYDQGATGISATRAFWAGMPEDVVTPGLFTGREADNGLCLQEVNGITIAYLSYAEQTNGLPTPTDAEAFVIYTSETDVIEAQVRHATAVADVVVVGVHWGTENSHVVNDAQRTLASQLTAWGADVILGTHPHVIQTAEWVTDPGTGNTAFVAYSLGNFLSAQAQQNQMVGLALTFELVLTVQPDGTRGDAMVENIQIYPTVIHYDAGYKNIRDYMYRDYTDELATQHGTGGFSRAYIENLVREYIPAEYLVLD